MGSIYALCNPESGELRYIGKANNPRARLAGHIRDSRRRDTPVYRWMRKLAAAGHTPEMVVLADNCTDWRAEDRRLIESARASGYRLLNVADGGDEPHCSIEVRRKNAERFNTDSGLVAYREMLRSASEVVRAWKGRPEKAARLAELEKSIATIRAFTHEQKIKAGARWASRLAEKP